MAKFLDITGDKYGKLVVLEYGYKKDKKNYWKCVCECGKETTVSINSLRTGNSKSCGCLQKEIAKKYRHSTTHGKFGTRIYQTWSAMKSRCYNSKVDSYKRYGARGITVCEDWKNDFTKFYEWAMNNGYEDDLTIERLNANGNYSPNNCTFIPGNQQSNNRRCSIFVKIGNETRNITGWEKATGIGRMTLYRRYHKGLRGEDLIKKE